MATLSEVVFAITFGKPDETNLTKAEKDSKAAAANVTKQWKDAGASIAKAFATLGAAAVGAGVGIFKLVEGVANSADAIAKTAKQLGISATGFQRLSFVLERSGGDAAKLKASMRALTLGLTEAAMKGTGPVAEGLAAIGLNAASLAGLGVEEQVSTIADAMGGLATEQERAGITMKIFGAEGAALKPLLDEGREGIKGLGDEAERLGLVMGDDLLESSEKFADELLGLKSAVKGLVAQVAGGLIPKFSQWIVTAREWIIANREIIQQKMDVILDRVVEVLKSLASAAQTFLPILSNILGLFGKLTEALGPTGAAGAMIGFKVAMTGALGPIGLVAVAIGTITTALIGMAEEAQNARFELLELAVTKNTAQLNDSPEVTALLAQRKAVSALLQAQLKRREDIGDFSLDPFSEANARVSDDAAAGFAAQLKQIDGAVRKIREKKGVVFEDAPLVDQPALPPGGVPPKRRGGGGKKSQDGILIDTGDDLAEEFRPELEALARQNGLSASTVDSALSTIAESLTGGFTRDVARNAGLSRLGSFAGKDFTSKGSDPLLSELLGTDVPDIELSAIARGAEPQTLISTINNHFNFANNFDIDGAGNPTDVGQSVASQIVDAFQGALAASTKTAKVVFAR